MPQNMMEGRPTPTNNYKNRKIHPDLFGSVNTLNPDPENNEKNLDYLSVLF